MLLSIKIIIKYLLKKFLKWNNDNNNNNNNSIINNNNDNNDKIRKFY